MEEMNMNAGFYGVNMNMNMSMGEYVQAGSMMALMTEQEQEQQPANGESVSMSIPAPSSAFSSYSQGHVEGLLSAAAVFHGGGNPPPPGHHHNHHHLSKHPAVGSHFAPEQLAMNEQAAAVISDSSLSSVKTEACSNHLDFHTNVGEGRLCCPEPSLIVRPPQSRHTQSHSHHQEASRLVKSMEVESACSTNPNDSIDALKTKIAGHPRYPRLLTAYIECQKIGAPPEVVAVLDEMSQEKQHGRHSPTISIGADPELDQFMEVYYEMLGKYQVELTRPYKEWTAFMNKIETQLNSLSIGGVRNYPSGYLDEREGGGSSEEEFSCGEIDLHEVDARAEDRELKDQLLRKYSGYFSSLKQEFLKKKKKGKLPKEARQKLLEWWNLHFKWPYPSETDKAALAESTGLDQKQINNWFINQRKRHWKPAEDVHYMVMDPLNPHTASFFIDAAEG